MAIETISEGLPQIVKSTELDFEELRRFRSFGVPELLLTNENFFEDKFVKFVELIGANIIGDPKIVKFDGEFTGFTGVAVIGASSVTAHTYLEKGQRLDLTVETCTKLPYLDIAPSIIYDLFGNPEKIQEVIYNTPDIEDMERELNYPFAFRNAGLALAKSNLYVNGVLVSEKNPRNECS